MGFSSPLLCSNCLSNLDILSEPLVDTELHKSVSNLIRSGFGRSSIPSQKFEQINAFVTESSETLEHYHKAITEIEGRLLAMKTARDDLQRRFDDARSLISSPIRNLPSEALNEIFAWICQRGNSSHSLSLRERGSVSCPTLELSWVCSWWRTSIQSSPELWSSIEVASRRFQFNPSSFELFLKYISYSGNHPLDFCYDLDTDYRFNSRRVAERALDVLLDNSTRWRRAALIVPKHGSNDWFLHAASRLASNVARNPERAHIGSFPILEYLEIPRHLPWASGLISFFQTLTVCPRLQTYHGTVFSWSGSSIDISHLRELSVTFLFGESIPGLIRRIPTLQCLFIEYVKLNLDLEDPIAFDEAPSHIDPREISHSSLKKIQIPNTHFSPQSWNSLRLPDLKHLQIDFSRQSIDAPFFSMLEDSKCQLETLRVRMSSTPLKAALGHFLTLHPTLLYLSVDFSSAEVLRAFLGYFKLENLAPNLRALEVGCKYRPDEIKDASLCPSICEVVMDRCTIHTEGDPAELYGLQALTVVLNHQNSYLIVDHFIHTNLAHLEAAGFQVEMRKVTV
ncbi:hypothetical protein F5880DRAFT_1569172 [Lentinula raphanica]|nr:hypothetical protein F5880DRAFT_1569172 [Lentinula raphanica]